ncbi:hypothetical protein N8I77_013018 [Diaporthe amygdali]|uniref:Uncharacterized protein n=1 Tax=Phomopsis amygdali TaxID=1214568 RepID=A0AAD9VYL1_PHOAM|nr:hypothetical protein N8I77_013018 [Diaporthe amygdali]
MPPPRPQSETKKRRPGCDGCRSSTSRLYDQFSHPLANVTMHLTSANGATGDTKEQCSQCVKRGQPCVRGIRVRFRHTYNPGLDQSQYNFDSDQTWCKTTNKRIRFVDETEEVASFYEGDVSDDDDDGFQGGTLFQDLPSPDASTALSPTPTARAAPSRSAFFNDTGSAIASSTSRAYYEQEAGPRQSLPDYPGPRTPALNVFPTPSSFPSPETAHSNNPHPLYPRVDASLLPLKNAHEAELIFQFSVQIAPQFDTGDHEKTFASVLPNKSSICPLLSKAILAVTAKSTRINRGGSPSPEEEAYLRDAFQELAPILSGCVVGMVDESTGLLAAAVLLQHHMVVQTPREKPIAESDSLDMRLIQSKLVLELVDFVGQPVLWASVRQSIYMAIMHQKPPVLYRECLNIDPTATSPGDDRKWAARITLLLVDVICYCFGEDKSLAEHTTLVEYAEEWMKNRPETFSPVFVCKEDDRPFPEIFLLNENVVLGLQYYHLVRILLIAYDPGIPRLGLEQKAAVRSMDDTLREDVRIVCGIADAISDVNNAHLAASMAIALAGDRFDDPDEQQALMDVLVRTEKDEKLSDNLEELA